MKAILMCVLVAIAGFFVMRSITGCVAPTGGTGEQAQAQGSCTNALSETVPCPGPAIYTLGGNIVLVPDANGCKVGIGVSLQVKTNPAPWVNDYLSTLSVPFYTITGAGRFTFPLEIAAGAGYNIIVSSIPGVAGGGYDDPSQAIQNPPMCAGEVADCVVTQGDGVVTGNVTNVLVTCTPVKS